MEVSLATLAYSVEVCQGWMETMKREVSFERHNFGVRQTSAFTHKFFQSKEKESIKLHYHMKLLHYCIITI